MHRCRKVVDVLTVVFDHLFAVELERGGERKRRGRGKEEGREGEWGGARGERIGDRQGVVCTMQRNESAYMPQISLQD